MSNFPMVITMEDQKAPMCVSMFKSKDETQNQNNALVFYKGLGLQVLNKLN